MSIEEGKQNGESAEQQEVVPVQEEMIPGNPEDLAALAFLASSENPILQDLQNHLTDVFAQGEKGDVIEASLKKIRSSVFIDLIAYHTWKHKGRVEGLHPDFGKLSYIRSNKIPSNYHINDEDRMELLLNLSDKLSSM